MEPITGKAQPGKDRAGSSSHARLNQYAKQRPEPRFTLFMKHSTREPEKINQAEMVTRPEVVGEFLGASHSCITDRYTTRR